MTQDIDELWADIRADKAKMQATHRAEIQFLVFTAVLIAAVMFAGVVAWVTITSGNRSGLPGLLSPLIRAV